MPERVQFKPPWSPDLQQVAEGVWLVRGDLRHSMNIYLLEDEGGVTAFDAGTRPMVKAVKAAADKLGGLKRVVLGHSHCDHRGTAPHLGVPVYCHPDEAGYAAVEGWQDTDYWDLDKLSVAPVRWLYKNWMLSRWDGGSVEIAGTVSEGDEICGFEVIHFPGHAPGMIGLWRASDRLAICSDTVYFADGERFKPLDHPVVPTAAFNWSTPKAAESVRKLAALDPATVAAGHDDPHSPPDIREQLERAADAI